jgi:hypothetical protein
MNGQCALQKSSGGEWQKWVMDGPPVLHRKTGLRPLFSQ